MSTQTIGYAAQHAGATLTPFTFSRRDLRANDVAIEILYCGVCHSDLHAVRNDWGDSHYPLVPGHEIVGRVSAIGAEVQRYAVGDHVAVGCLVDACLACPQCYHDNEQYCYNGNTLTYNGTDKISQSLTQGGYSQRVIVREEFVLAVPENLDLSRTAPLLCAGITTYSPLRSWNVGPGSRVAIIGLGGLGHMAVKLANGLGATTTVIGRTDRKKTDAFKLGADAYLVSNDEEAMFEARNQFDLIIDTIPVEHDVNPYLPLLDVDGTLVIVGQLGAIASINTVPMVMGRRSVAGSVIGGIAETQELLDFCASKNILPECEMIHMDQINDAFIRMEKSDVHYRFVIDMATLANKAA